MKCCEPGILSLFYVAVETKKRRISKDLSQRIDNKMRNENISLTKEKARKELEM